MVVREPTNPLSADTIYGYLLFQLGGLEPHQAIRIIQRFADEFGMEPELVMVQMEMRLNALSESWH
jgi:hypothetical protein